MLHDGACASRLGWNTLHLLPALTSSLAFIDSATCRGNDVVGIARIDIDGKDVGIIDDASL